MDATPSASTSLTPPTWTFQLCEYCKRLGATIRCRAEGCSRFYHFPCSAASGSFQSLKQLALLCPEHIDKAEEMGEDTHTHVAFMRVGRFRFVGRC